jgi:hypothetical protein
MTRPQAAPDCFADRTFVPAETYDALTAVLQRLEALIADETRLLRAHQHQHLAELTRQKRQGLLDLNRLMRALSNTIPSQDLLQRLATFRQNLAANQEALQVELRAAQAINAIIVRVMRELESDGTYSRAYGRADYGSA